MDIVTALLTETYCETKRRLRGVVSEIFVDSVRWVSHSPH